VRRSWGWRFLLQVGIGLAIGGAGMVLVLGLLVVAGRVKVSWLPGMKHYPFGWITAAVVVVAAVALRLKLRGQCGLVNGASGRDAARRAGATAVALLAVTTGLAVLLTILFHQVWIPVVVAIIGTAPSLYLAWAALPGAMDPTETGAATKSAFGRLVDQWDPLELGAHKVIGGGPMPPYVPRRHDELLRALLTPAVSASRLVVLRGGSSTGKTRAAYEAVAARLATWRLDYPWNAVALAERLEAGIPERTVLWLGELRQYVDADSGPAVLGRLPDLLNREGVVLITTVWPEDWAAYTADRDDAGSATAAAGRLLTRLPNLTDTDLAEIDPARGGVIDIPPEFTDEDLEAVYRTGDPVLAAAADAAGRVGCEGQVVQYLAGVPELLDRFHGPADAPYGLYGQAVIAAAIDAARLGHATPLPAALLHEAAVDYLTAGQRTQDIAAWGEAAVAWASQELRGAVRALEPVPPPGGTGIAGYRVADYLDQLGRRTRKAELGPGSLWNAFAARTASVADLHHLGRAAYDRGLYRHAAAIWTAAAARGSSPSALSLTRLLRNLGSGDVVSAAGWLARVSDAERPLPVAELLNAFDEAGAGDAARELADRAAARVSISDLGFVPRLLGEMSKAGADEAVRILAMRAAAEVDIDDQETVAHLLWVFRRVGAADALHALAERDPDRIRLEDIPAIRRIRVPTLNKRPIRPYDVLLDLAMRPASRSCSPAARGPGDAELERRLVELRAGDPLQSAKSISLADPKLVARFLLGLIDSKEDEAAAVLTDRHPAAHTNVADPQGVAALMGALRKACAHEEMHALALRAADTVSVDDPWEVGRLILLLSFRPSQAEVNAAQALGRRAAAQTDVSDTEGVFDLLKHLRRVKDSEAMTTLLAQRLTSCHPPAQTEFTNPRIAEDMLAALHDAGDHGSATALAARAAQGIRIDRLDEISSLLVQMHKAGADEAARSLAWRVADTTSLDQIESSSQLAIRLLVSGMSKAGISDAAHTLATRGANLGLFDLMEKNLRDGAAAAYPFGREPNGTPSKYWRWKEPDK
jgi:hypothetical protein